MSVVARRNERAAGALRELAELLALSGGDPHRVRAYENAARAVAAHPAPLEGLDTRALDAIASVGSHIARQLREFLDTGAISELEELRAHVPAGLSSLLEVPGLGPKRARQLGEELGISSLTELSAALRGGRLRTLKGWGPASEARLAAAVRHFEEAAGRLLLPRALDLAEELVGALRSLPAVERADYAGSLRRMRETIGDIDLLVASSAPAEVMDQFGHLPGLAAVPMRGPTKAVASTTGGVHVDLRVVGPDSYGAALVYFTGSKAHNIHLRRLARAQGCKLSEYGLFDAAGRTIAARTEREVYAALGLAFVPPPLREDRGEIEAAARHGLPHLVELGDISGDLHTHSSLTDGRATLEEMVAEARRRRYRYFALTDHGPQSPAASMTAEKALARRAVLRALERPGGPVLWYGAELSIAPDGGLGFDDAFLGGFDLLIAAVHTRLAMGRDEMTRRLVAAVEHPAVNILGHPTARVIGRRGALGFDADAVFEAAARAGTALEINAAPDRLDLSDELARRALGLGALFAISSDAHELAQLDNLRYGVAVAQRAWIPPERVINTWPTAQLRHFLRKGRAP